ncbi:polyphosphate kinase [Azospirillum argentinense]|uniref:Polyphosphate kinase n=1 Tax=Azospirillum argentinense TaxID=2970906 RepID=A0A4D8PCA8_9PROT|nr:PPK2 family polyphosphate kinase [Azospirillum argentinense]QCN93897.1 polyphosphate kinase [Azospirillum argentinense]
MGNGNGKIRLDKLDMTAEGIGSKDDYERRLAKLQKDLLHIQQTYWHEKRRAILVFEGWDAAGKGGCIRRLTEPLDPRGFHVWPIGTPTAEEQGKHYLYRFWTKLPAPGTFAIFDRSWYGRVLVERVEGFAEKEQWKRAYDEINQFEKMLTDDGVRIIKIFMHITPDEQLNRFRERLSNPYKRWKLTEEDLRNRSRWDDYSKAIEAMFDKTSTETAPWQAVPANSKWHARLRVMEIVTEALSRGVNVAPPPIDLTVARIAAEVLGVHLTFDTKEKD